LPFPRNGGRMIVPATRHRPGGESPDGEGAVVATRAQHGRGGESPYPLQVTQRGTEG